MKRNKHCCDIERILASYECLRQKIELDKKDIEDLKKEGRNEETKHRLINPDEWNPDIDDNIRQLQKIRNRERSMIRTKNMLNRLDGILDIIRKDEYYPVIHLSYFESKTLTEISMECELSVRTIARHKTRLLNELAILFYGADALE